MQHPERTKELPKYETTCIKATEIGSFCLGTLILLKHSLSFSYNEALIIL